jgi:hypothetical protein
VNAAVPIAMPAGGAGSLDTAMTNATAFLARNLSSLLNTTFAQLAGVKSPDIDSSGFLSTYAAGSGIAMFVLVVTLARLFHRTSAGEMSGQALAESLWRWAPTAMLLVLFGPGLGQLTVQLIDAATGSIVEYFGDDVAALPKRLTTMVVIDDPSGFPGGPIAALLIMGVAFVGVAGLVGGLLAQTLVLYLTGAVMSIAFIAMIDPGSRARAMRLPSLWLGLLLGKPLLFFLVGVTARITESTLEADSGADPGWKRLMPALMGAIALLLVGLAPWTLVRITARPPDRQTRAPQPGGVSLVVSQAPSATMLRMSHRRMHDAPVGLPGRMANDVGGLAPGVLARAAPTAGNRRKPAVAARPEISRGRPMTPAAPADDDGTELPPFGEQAIDAAPPAVPNLVQREAGR